MAMAVFEAIFSIMTALHMPHRIPAPPQRRIPRFCPAKPRFLATILSGQIQNYRRAGCSSRPTYITQSTLKTGGSGRVFVSVDGNTHVTRLWPVPLRDSGSDGVGRRDRLAAETRRQRRKVPAPLFRDELPGSTAWGSLLVKW